MVVRRGRYETAASHPAEGGRAILLEKQAKEYHKAEQTNMITNS
jgi:hypothetical protein